MNDNRLSAVDAAHLVSLRKKIHLLWDLVTAVAKSYKTGLFLHGPGGVGKSYNVLTRLKDLDVPFIPFNSRMTPKGLFQTLEKAPDAVFVLEDMERLTKEPDAQGVLRSALWAQPGQDRVVTWTTAKEGERRFVFRGGLILISNRPLADLAELRALATRIEVHRLDVTDAELTALMRELAFQGYRQGGKLALAAAECGVVTEYLLSECRTAGCPLDLRLQQKSFQTYLQWASDNAFCDWRDLVAASVREATHHFRHALNTLSPEDKKKQRRNVIREIVNLTADVKEQERLYTERTGAKHADFFRRKREVETGDFDEEDAA
ncbi:MAG TPA: hypothetical protein VMF69_25100 [Gemmataceae bacterium]|nr:hypothetical protein [Gemmataceae bacterium]